MRFRPLAILAALLAHKPSPTAKDLDAWRRRCADADPIELGHLIHTAENDEFMAIAIDEAARRDVAAAIRRRPS